VKLVRALSKVVMVDDDQRINAPMSFFLNTHKNPNTLESLARSLKLLHIFLTHLNVHLADRALEGRCLEEREQIALISLAFRSLRELSDPRNVARQVDVRKAEPDEDRKGAVDGSTASKRLIEIASFLEHYATEVSKYIKSPDVANRLAAAYQATCDRLRKAVGGAASNSTYDIRSMSSDDFIECMKAAYSRPTILLGQSQSARHLFRDRAMFMLSCEGLRPGEICNLRLNDLVKRPDGLLTLQVVVNKKYRATVKSSTPLPKGASSNEANYATVRQIHLWPFTRDALNDYMNGPRAAAIAEAGQDISAGFLFVKSNGEQILSRQAVSLRFGQMCDALHEAGLMKIDTAPGRLNATGEELSSYTMRHSAASYLYESMIDEGVKEEVVHDRMKARFGWTDKSPMPAHYGKRAIVNGATARVTDVYNEMRAEVERIAGQSHAANCNRSK
jgi:integrase